MSAGTVVVPIRPGSDGDATHRPDRSTHTLVDPPTLYLEKIASLWMESRGEALPGKLYHIYISFFFQCYFWRQGSIHFMVADFIFDPPIPQFLSPLTTYRRKIYAWQTTSWIYTLPKTKDWYPEACKDISDCWNQNCWVLMITRNIRSTSGSLVIPLTNILTPQIGFFHTSST